MLTLAIDTATEVCSVALFEGVDLVRGAFEVIGRGHAERLVPMIAELPGKGRADRIAVSLGPGSFTGVRIGVAAARALALAWRADVVGYPTLALVAAMARQHRQDAVSVCMAGGHGQWFVQSFEADGLPSEEVRSLSPADAATAGVHRVIVGTRAAQLAALLAKEHVVLDGLLPDARAFSAMPAALLSSAITPIYGRPPDARLPDAAR